MSVDAVPAITLEAMLTYRADSRPFGGSVMLAAKTIVAKCLLDFLHPAHS